MRGPFVKATVTVVRTSKQSVLCQFEDGYEAWIAESQIHDDSEISIATKSKAEDKGKLVTTKWLIETKEVPDANYQDYEP